MTRIRVAGTVDAAIAEDFDKEFKEFKEQAEKAKAPIPTQSDLLQEVIKKGLWQIRKQNRTAQ